MIRPRLGAVATLVTLALAVPWFGAAPRVAACTYIDAPGDPVVEGDLVFTGTAVAWSDRAPSGFRSAAGYHWWTFAIDAVRHGRVSSHESVQTADDEAACGAPLELGHRYLVGVDTDSWMISGASIHELEPLKNPPPVESFGLDDLGPLVPLLVVAAVLIGIAAIAFRRRGVSAKPPVSGR